MAKMIDSDAFRNYLKMMQEANKNSHKEYVYYLGYAIEHLNDFTDVEGMEIVRCKDCKHLVITSQTKSRFCNVRCTFQNMDDNNFCSYGERKCNDKN